MAKTIEIHWQHPRIETDHNSFYKLDCLLGRKAKTEDKKNYFLVMENVFEN